MFRGVSWLSRSVADLSSCTLRPDFDFLPFLRSITEDSVPTGRVRDVLPVPLIDLQVVRDIAEGTCHKLYGDLLLTIRVANLALQGLNIMMGHRVNSYAAGRCVPQRAVQLRSLHKASRWCEQLHEELPPEGHLAWAQLIGDEAVLGEKKRHRLEASRCDILTPSGRVDPLPFASEEARAILTCGETLFSGADLKHIRAAKINKDDRREYAQLVVRQLRAGKVGLRDSVLSSASVFAVGKSSGALREVWNGSEMSAAAMAPFYPPHLAGVSALTDLEAGTNDPIRVYKRDAQCFFDQLRLPCALRPFFGRPTLTAIDILRHTDMRLVELERYCIDIPAFSEQDTLHPVCLTWPMVFRGAATLRSRLSSTASRSLVLVRGRSSLTIARRRTTCH